MDKKQGQTELFDALMYFVGKEHRRVSKNVIISGLPTEKNQLTIEVFPRAALRAGFAAELTSTRLDQITDISYPYILIFKDHSIRILESFTEDNKACLYHPSTKERYQEQLQDLNEKYSGQLFSVKPVYYDERGESYQQKATNSIFWGTIAKHKKTYSHILVSSVLVNLFVFITPLFLMLIYDRVVPNSAYSTLWTLAIGAFTFFIFDFILRLVRTYFIDRISGEVDEAMSHRLYQHLLNVRMANKPLSIGSFANLFREFEMLRDFMTSATLVTLIDIPFVILFLIGIFVLAGPMVVLPIIGIILILGLTLIIEYPTRRKVHENLRSSTHKNALLIESLSAIEAIKSLNLKNSFQKRWEQSTRSTNEASSNIGMYTSIANNITTLIQQLITISVGIWGAYMIINGTMSIGELIAVTILTSRAMMVNQVISLLTRYERAKAGLNSLNQIFNLPTEIDSGKSYIEDIELKGDIDINDMSFTYPDRTMPVFDKINTSIKAGENVGIIGAIGSGKTTLLKLLAGLYAPTSGTIYFDGIDYTEIHPDELRRQVFFLSREHTLFFGSVRENIYMCNPEASDEQFLKAVRNSGVEQFARRHPMGYDMPVGENGDFLSSGQRQAVTLARTLICNCPLYLLDEPTADLDTHLEQDFISRAKSFFKNSTVVLSTHRTALLDLVDRIIVVGNQQIIADGKRDEVLNLLKQSKADSNNEASDNDTGQEEDKGTSQ